MGGVTGANSPFALRDYPHQQLSSRRVSVVEKADSLNSEDSIQTFRQDFTSTGGGERFIDRFRGRTKTRILEAAALCHIASFPKAWLIWRGQVKRGKSDPAACTC
jgi:hypothetical protein